jgi:hypothetical protein
MRKVVVLLGALVAVLVSVLAGTATGASTETGVTAKTVTIGGTYHGRGLVVTEKNGGNETKNE